MQSRNRLWLSKEGHGSRVSAGWHLQRRVSSVLNTRLNTLCAACRVMIVVAAQTIRARSSSHINAIREQSLGTKILRASVGMSLVMAAHAAGLVPPAPTTLPSGGVVSGGVV